MANAWESAPVAGEQPQASTSVFETKVPYSGLAETGRAAAQGLTFGFADELEAALRTGSISNQQYTQLRDQLRAQQKQFGADYPNVATPIEIAGGVAMPVGALKLLKGAPAGVQTGVTGTGLAGQMTRGAVVGGATGALTGAGTATDDVGQQTLNTGLAGAVLGGTVPVVIKRAGSLIRNVLNASGIGEQ